MEARILELRDAGDGILKIGKKLGIGTASSSGSSRKYLEAPMDLIAPLPSIQHALRWSASLMSDRTRDQRAKLSDMASR